MAWGRLWLMGLLAIVVSEVVNVLIVTIALAFLPPEAHTMQLQMPNYSFLTVVGALGALLVCALINKLSRQPIRLFRIIATIVLVISFIPDFLLLQSSNALAVMVLMVMHIATYLVTVGMMTTMARAK